MIKDSEKRLFDIVLVWKLDRFARNRYDSAHYEYQLERNHVKLVSAMDQRLFAPTQSLSQLITSFFASESQGIRHAPLLTFFQTYFQVLNLSLIHI